MALIDSASSGLLKVEGPTSGAVDLPITIDRVQCYVVCSTISATIQAETITRHQGGQVLGSGRVPVALNGGDTVAVDTISLAALRGVLSQFVRSGFPSDLRPKVAPCSDAFTTHVPVFTIEWQTVDGRHRLRVDSACHEPTGLVDALAAAAQRAIRIDELAIRPR